MYNTRIYCLSPLAVSGQRLLVRDRLWRRRKRDGFIISRIIMDNHLHHYGREHRTGDLLDSNLWNFKHLSSCNAMSQLQKYFRCIEDWRGDFTNVIRHFSLPMLGFSYLLSPSRGRMSGERSAAGAEGETAWPEQHPQHHQTTWYLDISYHLDKIFGYFWLFKVVCWCWFSSWAAAERLEQVFIQALSLATWSTLLGV